MVRVKTLRKLINNSLRYQVLKLTGRPGNLESISLEITHRCICRCQMCNIWQIPPDVPDLPLATWTGLLSSAEMQNLREIDITGGEPFLHKDLSALIFWICRAKATHFPELRTLAITTNGILTDGILAITSEVLGPMKEQGVDLVFACGLDTTGPKHDHIRNLPGAWEKLSATLEGLKLLRQNFPNLILGIKTTIVPDNVQELGQIVSFARKHKLFTIISPCIITENRFGNIDRQQGLKFSPEDLKEMGAFYTDMDKAWSGHRQTMLDYLETGEVEKPCSAGFNTVFVRHNGEVYPCPVIPSQLGNIKQEEIGTLLANATATRFRKNIGSFTECRSCTEPGLERIAWPFEGYTCLRRIFQLGGKESSRLFAHMGLDKYF